MLNIINKRKYSVYLILLFTSFLIVFFNTVMSPFLPIGYLPHDPSVFYTIGRGMKAGLLPYKDLFDHKGIYIYFMYYFAALISENNQIGLYIIFSLVTFIFSIFVYKIFILYDKSENKFASMFSTFLLMIMMISFNLSHAGLHSEHIAIITILISIYMMIKYIETESNYEKGFNAKYMFINGILAAINIFNKPNYTIYFVAVALYVFYDLVIIKKNIKLLFLNIIYGLCGVLVGLAPGVIYCAFNGIIKDMIFAVFTFNMSYAGDFTIDMPSNVNTPIDAIWFCIRLYKFSIAAILLSVIICLKKCKKIFAFYLISVILVVFAVLYALKAYTYYQTLFLPFFMPIVFLAFNIIYKIILNKNKIIKVMVTVVLSISLIILSYKVGYNSLIGYYEFDARETLRVSMQIKKIMKNNKNAKILCYGLGENHYNNLGIIPTEKYFYIPTISYDRFKDSYDSLYDAVVNYKYDIVIFEVNDFIYNNSLETVKFLNNNYECVLDYSKYRKVYVKKDV